ncbi:MAG: MBL fold metallo-hydrolase [Bacteroidetes bacterium]|nr:MBL fold metallo-hydrolase [Bacteroidota bacterium]
MTLKPAVKKDEALVAEMDALLHDERLHIWWLGQSGFLIQWQGYRALVDPYLSDSLTRKYEHTDKPHTRMSERVIDPSLLRGITVVSSSHNHTDHLDAATLQPVLKNNPGVTFIIPEANRQFVQERVQCDPDFPVGLNDGQQTTVGPFTFYGIPAKHNEIDRDEKGQCKYMGYVITAGPHTIYHSGDTLWFDEMVTTLQPFAPDIALLPINGNDPARKVAGNLDTKEAVELARILGVKWVIPCHYDMFFFNTASVSDFVQEAEKQNQPYRVLQGGELFTC